MMTGIRSILKRVSLFGRLRISKSLWSDVCSFILINSQAIGRGIIGDLETLSKSFYRPSKYFLPLSRNKGRCKVMIVLEIVLDLEEF